MSKYFFMMDGYVVVNDKSYGSFEVPANDIYCQARQEGVRMKTAAPTAPQALMVLEAAIETANQRGISDVLLVICADFKTAYNRVVQEALALLSPADRSRVKFYIRRIVMYPAMPHSTLLVLRMMEEGRSAQEIIEQIHYTDQRTLGYMIMTERSLHQGAVMGRLPAPLKVLGKFPHNSLATLLGRSVSGSKGKAFPPHATGSLDGSAATQVKLALCVKPFGFKLCCNSLARVQLGYVSMMEEYLATHQGIRIMDMWIIHAGARVDLANKYKETIVSRLGSYFHGALEVVCIPMVRC